MTAPVRLSTARIGTRVPVDRNGPLRVTCWCEAAVVTVPAADVRAGRTRSCRRSDCFDPTLPDHRVRDRDHGALRDLGRALGGRAPRPARPARPGPCRAAEGCVVSACPTCGGRLLGESARRGCHYECEPTTCTCDEPMPNGIGECQSCFRLVLSHSWHAGIPSRPSSPASEGVASASVPSVACGSGATPPAGPVPTTGGTAA